MRIKLHITGYAVAYDNEARKTTRKGLPPLPTRPQGSLYSQQKHAIADGIEYMRTHAKHKPRIFLLTTPGFVDHSQEGKKLSKFLTNFRNNYGLLDYVWVREFTQIGLPHYHFVADVPEFDPVAASLYWSGLHNVQAKNSIRLGTKPNKARRRKFWIENDRMSWYMSKYIGKSVGECEKNAIRKNFRTFAISQELRVKSQPILYNEEIHHTYKGLHLRTFYLDNEYIEEGAQTVFNPHGYDWKWTGHGNCYTGFPKRKT